MDGMREREEKYLCAVQGQGMVGRRCNLYFPNIPFFYVGTGPSSLRVPLRVPLLCRLHFGSNRSTIPDRSLVTLSDFPFTTATSQEHNHLTRSLHFIIPLFLSLQKCRRLGERLGNDDAVFQKVNYSDLTQTTAYLQLGFSSSLPRQILGVHVYTSAITSVDTSNGIQTPQVPSACSSDIRSTGNIGNSSQLRFGLRAR